MNLCYGRINSFDQAGRGQVFALVFNTDHEVYGGQRPIHLDIQVPYVDEDGTLQFDDIENYAQFEHSLPLNTVAGENEGMWYGTALWMLRLWTIWFDLAKVNNYFSGEHLNTTEAGTIAA